MICKLLRAAGSQVNESRGHVTFKCHNQQIKHGQATWDCCLFFEGTKEQSSISLRANQS